MPEESHFFVTDTEDEGTRIDLYLTAALDGPSRSLIQKWINDGCVRVSGSSVKPGQRLRPNEKVEIDIPDVEGPDIEPEDIPLDIVHEDDQVLVVNKPQGMVVHPSAGHKSGTLVNALLYHCRDSLSGINGVLRPGIVHRIDKDTSGLLVVCKTDAAHRCLAAQLADHSCTRRYVALLHGVVKDDEVTIEGNIGRDPSDRKKMTVVTEDKGKRAVTHLSVIKRFAGYTYASFRLETGRTHQIRVHAKHIGHPVLGDPVYGPRKCPFPYLKGQMLHAMTLGFIHPSSGEYMEFEAQPPGIFEKVLSVL